MIDTHRLKTRGLNQIKRFLSNVDSKKEKKFSISYQSGQTTYRSSEVVSTPASRWLTSLVDGLPKEDVDSDQIEEELNEALKLTAVYLIAEKDEEVFNEFLDTIKSQDVVTENFDLEVEGCETSKVSAKFGKKEPRIVNIYYEMDGDWVKITSFEEEGEIGLLRGDYKFEAIYSGGVVEKEFDSQKASKIKLYDNLVSKTVDKASSALTNSNDNNSEDREKEHAAAENKENLSKEKADKSNNSNILFYGGAVLCLLLILISGFYLLEAQSPQESPETAASPINNSNRTSNVTTIEVDNEFQESAVRDVLHTKISLVREDNDLSKMNDLGSIQDAAESYSGKLSNESIKADDSDLTERLESFNIICSKSAENVVQIDWEREYNSTQHAEEIFSNLNSSEEERKKILDEEHKAHGIGITKDSGQIYVSQIFCG